MSGRALGAVSRKWRIGRSQNITPVSPIVQSRSQRKNRSLQTPTPLFLSLLLSYSLIHCTRTCLHNSPSRPYITLSFPCIAVDHSLAHSPFLPAFSASTGIRRIRCSCCGLTGPSLPSARETWRFRRPRVPFSEPEPPSSGTQIPLTLSGPIQTTLAHQPPPPAIEQTSSTLRIPSSRRNCY